CRTPDPTARSTVRAAFCAWWAKSLIPPRTAPPAALASPPAVRATSSAVCATAVVALWNASPAACLSRLKSPKCGRCPSARSCANSCTVPSSGCAPRDCRKGEAGCGTGRPRMGRFLRALGRQRASDRAVLRERGEGGQPLQAWKTLRATQGSVCLRVAKPGGELAGRGVAQQRLDARVQSPQRLQLPFPENDGGGLGKRAALVQRPRTGRPLRLARQPRPRRPALLEQRAERLQAGRAPPRS